MNVVSVPVGVLLNWRMPDRDIHRLLVTRGAHTTLQIAQALNVAAADVRRATMRLERLGLVSASGQRSGRGSGLTYTVASIPKPVGSIGGRVTPSRWLRQRQANAMKAQVT